MKRKFTPEHNFWHRRVEGQIRHTMGRHPEWFNFKNPTDQNHCINSLAKRIVGEILAVGIVAELTKAMPLKCEPRSGKKKR